MKLNITISKSLKPFFYKELELAESCLSNNDLKVSWYHLERAHILGQPYPYHHTLVHWKMLLFGIKIKDIQIDDEGSIYVGDILGNKIQKFRLIKAE